MRIQLLGWTGERLPVVGQGTWMLERHERGEAVAALRAGIEAGMTLIDINLLHWPGSHPIAETMRALASLVDGGEIRYMIRLSLKWL